MHALRIAKLAGGWVMAVDVNASRLELAQTLGADALVGTRQGPLTRPYDSSPMAGDGCGDCDAHELVWHEGERLGSRATTKQELQETMTLVAQGRITPIVDRIFPFEEVEAAFTALQQGHSLGRNVLAI